MHFSFKGEGVGSSPQWQLDLVGAVFSHNAATCIKGRLDVYACMYIYLHVHSTKIWLMDIHMHTCVHVRVLYMKSSSCMFLWHFWSISLVIYLLSCFRGPIFWQYTHPLKGLNAPFYYQRLNVLHNYIMIDTVTIVITSLLHHFAK
jgi:hypothetical protein